VPVGCWFPCQYPARLGLGGGVAAISFLAIGYWLGRRYSDQKRIGRDFQVDDIDAAASEDLTIGRSY
jgi:hypothetical protein